MALHLEGENALAARLTAEFGVTTDQARASITAAWMSLACGGDAPLDVAGLAFEQCGDFLWVHEGERMIATLEFEPGALPRRVVPPPPEADDADDDPAGWNAFWDHMDDLEARSLRAA
jgi:hypothetical protein